jgi:protein subunit release factor B
MSFTPEQRALARAALSLGDEALLGDCDVDVYVASGPGGQHRNKTESGVRLTHRPSGLVVTATERRSQLQNKGVALARLRERLQAWTFVAKKRRPTKPTKGSQERRITAKKQAGARKRERRSRDD